MQRILLHDALPGMILAEDVMNAQQMLLLKKGALLTAENIKILKSWGVSIIHVAVAPSADENPSRRADATPLESMEKATALKFAGVEDDPIMAEIRRVSVEIIAGRLANQI